jgi:hypothetical protein
LQIVARAATLAGSNAVAGCMEGVVMGVSVRDHTRKLQSTSAIKCAVFICPEVSMRMNGILLVAM